MAARTSTSRAWTTATGGHVLDFADQAVGMRYHDDPEHKALGARLVAAADGAIDSLLVVDFELPTAQP